MLALFQPRHLAGCACKSPAYVNLAIPRVLPLCMQCQYSGKYLVSPKACNRMSLCLLCACTVWVSKPLHAFPKAPLKSSSAHSPLFFSPVPFGVRLPQPLCSLPNNKLPCGFFVHCASFSPPLNYNTVICLFLNSLFSCQLYCVPMKTSFFCTVEFRL